MLNNTLLVKKLALFLGGLAFVGLGVNLIVESRLGGDSITVLYMGLSKTFSIAYGTSAYIYNIIIIITAILFARKYIGLGTFIYAFVVGSFVYLFEFLFSVTEVVPASILGQYTFFFFGQVLLAFGLAMTITLKVGLNGLDCIILVLQNKFKMHYRTLKVGMDLTITAIGFALGGIVGVGTVISVMTLGVLIHYFVDLFKKYNMFYSHLSFQES